MRIRYDRRKILQVAMTSVGLSAGARLFAQTATSEARPGIVLSQH